MILGPRRIALGAAIAAVVIVIVLYPLLAKNAEEFDPMQVDIGLSKVDVAQQNQTDSIVTIMPTFTFTNRNDVTLTTESIDYQIFADGKSVGTSTISYADVPVVGRPEMFTNSTVSIPGSFYYQLSSDNADIFKKVRDSSTSVNWTATGTASIESGTTVLDRPFTVQLQK